MITHLCVKNPATGTIEGTCCVCGKETKQGFKNPFSDNFAGYSYLTHGNCTCPHCCGFFKNQDFRKRSWVATNNSVTFLKRAEILKAVLDPPAPPFAIYITQGGKRQGWLSGLKLVNYGRENFYIFTDFVDTVYTSRLQAQSMSDMISELRKNKVGKTQLITGEYAMHVYKKAIEGGWHHLIEQARTHTKKPLWEVMVYLDCTET